MNVHPLVNELSEIKDADLESKIQDLSKKYHMVSNPALKDQIVAMINVYKDELTVRRAKQLEQLYKKRDKNLDKLVNVT